MFSKPLKRYITASLIKEYMALAPSNEKIIYEAFPKYGDLKSELNRYAVLNTVKGDSSLFNELKDVARENNLWDMEIYHKVEQFKKIMEDFGFLSYLKPFEGNNISNAEKKSLRNLVYSILKLKKIESNFITDYEVVRRIPPKPFKVDITNEDDESKNSTIFFDDEQLAIQRFKDERRNGDVSYSKWNPEKEEYYRVESFSEGYDEIEDEYWDFWRPEIDTATGKIVDHEDDPIIPTNAVWRSKDKLEKDYEYCNPVGYKHGDIVNPVFMDDVTLPEVVAEAEDISPDDEDEEEEAEIEEPLDEDDLLDRERDLNEGNEDDVEVEVGEDDVSEDVTL